MVGAKKPGEGLVVGRMPSDQKAPISEGHRGARRPSSGQEDDEKREVRLAARRALNGQEPSSSEEGTGQWSGCLHIFTWPPRGQEGTEKRV